MLAVGVEEDRVSNCRGLLAASSHPLLLLLRANGLSDSAGLLTAWARASALRVCSLPPAEVVNGVP